jgi:TRAP-type C4-dicarboxylate transport system substrate-binding protein
MAGGALVGATLTGGRLAAADYTVRVAHSLSTTEPAHQAAEFFAKNVTERSAGNVQVSAFAAEPTGSSVLGVNGKRRP